jgi:hypothetical protein
MDEADAGLHAQGLATPGTNFDEPGIKHEIADNR